jgi:hypothetical protein
VIEFEPTLSAEEVMLTVPFESSVPIPSEFIPFRNSTVPVGVPEPGLMAVTVAVKVTVAPEFDGLGTPTTTVFVSAATVAVSCADVLVLKLGSPSYLAVSVLVPMGSDDVVSIAVPFVRGTLWIKVMPFMKSTLPVGVPIPGLMAVTVAVSTTGLPRVERDGETVRAVVLLACITVMALAVESLPR